MEVNWKVTSRREKGGTAEPRGAAEQIEGQLQRTNDERREGCVDDGATAMPVRRRQTTNDEVGDGGGRGNAMVDEARQKGSKVGTCVWKVGGEGSALPQHANGREALIKGEVKVFYLSGISFEKALRKSSKYIKQQRKNDEFE